MHFPSCRVWDVNDGSLVNRLDHHSGPVQSLKFNSDTMVTCSWVLCIVYLSHVKLSKTGYEWFASTYFKHEVPITP